MPVHNVYPHSAEQANPTDLLAAFGLLLEVEVAPPQALASLLTSQGKPLPQLVTGSALVDTGASCCCVEESLLQKLQLQPVNEVEVSSPNGNKKQNVYFVRLSFPGSPIPALELPVVGVQLNQGHTISLIGRDLLRHCVLIYNGPMGSYTITF
jgi:predicted aspartyl protease